MNIKLEVFDGQKMRMARRDALIQLERLRLALCARDQGVDVSEVAVKMRGHRGVLDVLKICWELAQIVEGKAKNELAPAITDVCYYIPRSYGVTVQNFLRPERLSGVCLLEAEEQSFFLYGTYKGRRGLIICLDGIRHYYREVWAMTTGRSGARRYLGGTHIQTSSVDVMIPPKTLAPDWRTLHRLVGAYVEARFDPDCPWRLNRRLNFWGLKENGWWEQCIAPPTI